MRSQILFSLVAVPALVMAQAPSTPETYAAKYQKEIPVVEGLLKELKAKEAQARLEALLPAELPKYDVPTLDEMKANYGVKFSAVISSQQNYHGLTGLHVLLAKALIAQGEWEKAKATLEKAQQLAKDNNTNFQQAITPVQALWGDMVKAAEEFKTKNAGQAKEIAAKPPASNEPPKPVNPKDPKAKEPAPVKVERTVDEEGFLKWYQDNLTVHEGNIDKAGKIGAFLKSALSDTETNIKLVSDSLGALDKNTKDQAEEIRVFNEDQLKKKKKVEGNKTWVNAVLNKPENLTNLPTPKAQVEFLNRLLVLDPGNEKSTKALGNLLQGKEPFAKEAPKPKAPAKGKPKKG
jgi:tetratricopeptide (TPR) repeat protein